MDPCDQGQDLAKQVFLARAWLVKNTIKTRRYNRNFTSYGLKHKIERDCGDYISMDAVILAAIDLGYNIVAHDKKARVLGADFTIRGGLFRHNMFFKLRFKKLKDAPPNDQFEDLL